MEDCDVTCEAYAAGFASNDRRWFTAAVDVSKTVIKLHNVRHDGPMCTSRMSVVVSGIASRCHGVEFPSMLENYVG